MLEPGGGQRVNEREREHMAKLDHALTIAAEMFEAEGYVAPGWDGGAGAIKRFLLRKSGQELRRLKKKEPRPL